MRAYMKFIYSRADLILPVSPMAAESLRSMGIKKPIKVLYNGIEMSNFITSKSDRISAKQALDLLEKSFVVVGNGQIQARKRFDLFCEVAEQLPDMTFIWVGGSPFGRLSDDYARLQQLVDNPPRNVIVTGVVPYSEVGKYMRAADVFWLPSNQENHPMAALEAAGTGIPLLMRDIAEYDESFGQDIIRGDDLTFKDQLLKLRDDRSFYQAGLNGSKRIAKRYDNQTIISTLIEHYKSLLNNP